MLDDEIGFDARVKRGIDCKKIKFNSTSSFHSFNFNVYIYIYNKRIFYYHLEFVFNNKYNQPLNVKFISREIKQTIFPQFFKF